MSKVIENLERQQLRKGIPGFDPGDRVKVHFQVVEGTRRRTQVFEGTVIKRQGSGARETFTVRTQSFGVGVERTFPVHSPKVERIEVASRGDVRRAKLYYLRGRVGKRARVAERRWGIEDDLVLGEAEEPQALDTEGESQEEADVEASAAGEPEPPEGEADDAESSEAEARSGDDESSEASDAEGEGRAGEPQG